MRQTAPWPRQSNVCVHGNAHRSNASCTAGLGRTRLQLPGSQELSKVDSEEEGMEAVHMALVVVAEAP